MRGPYKILPMRLLSMLLNFGKYSTYIWSAYIITFIVLAIMFITSVRMFNRAKQQKK